MITIKNSPLAPYFSDVSDATRVLRDIFVLETDESMNFWAAHFDARARGFHDLSQDSWVLKAAWTVIGSWIDAYNGAASAKDVGQTIEEASGWALADDLALIQNRRNVVLLKRKDFDAYWKELFAAFDDGPILMSRSDVDGTVFSFSPLGDILRASRF